MVRSVRIDRFGVWNCDKAIALNSIPILATFKDINGNTIELTHIAVLYKSLKRDTEFSGQPPPGDARCGKYDFRNL